MRLRTIETFAKQLPKRKSMVEIIKQVLFQIRKPSSVINAKKQRKTIEWERLEISSRKLDIPREGIFVFHPKMGTINDRNGMDLIEAEDIRKRCQEYTEELYKKDLCDPDTTMV